MLTVITFCSSACPMSPREDDRTTRVRDDTKIVVLDSRRLVYSSIIVVVNSVEIEKAGMLVTRRREMIGCNATSSATRLPLLFYIFVGGDSGQFLEMAEEGRARAEPAHFTHGGEGVSFIASSVYKNLEFLDTVFVDVVIVALVQILVE